MTDPCDKIRPMIHASLDGELAENDRRRLDLHVGACGACAGLLSAGELAIASLRALPTPEPGPGFAASIARGIAAARMRRVRVQRRLSWAAAVGTCIASALFVATWLTLSESIWDAVSCATRVVAPLANTMAGTAITLGRCMVPIGGALAKLSWPGVDWLATYYASALAALLVMVIVTKFGHRLARVPILSL
ncbi:MAG TPA: zf-HC2 domain-containing protein [Verrucomicrobiae bacterium]|nr:zf-HC2 domain-containing protein [Verrucomicrobiae bacterium]